MEHILQEWETVRLDLTAAIRTLPADKLEQPFVFPWGSSGTLERIVAILAEHEEEHAMEIRRLSGLPAGEASEA